MSIVHLAERVSDGEQVVVKILRDELFENEDFRRRFLRESRYAESLDHPNVVKVLDSGQTASALYIAMQYVEGSDLYALLEQGPIDAAEAVAILAQVGAALDAAHAIGLLHRDVKPGNVLLASRSGGRAPRCYLTDFGLSKHTTKDSVALTAAGTFVGTLTYMAPEQMIGPEPGAAADVYSLGCVLFECLSGKPPFSGTDVEVMQQHIESEPPKLSGRRSAFSPELDAVLGRAMAKEPGERHPSCVDLIADAAAALGVQPPAVVSAEVDGTLELLVTAGNSVGATIRVGKELLIGREEAGDGTLGADLEISRRHARISRETSGGLMVEDLGSTNGTYLNGRQIVGLESLRPGDEVELGATKLLVFVAAEEAEVVESSVAQPSQAPPDPALPGVSRLSVRLVIRPLSGEAWLRLDERSEAVRLVRDEGSWKFGTSSRQRN